MTGGMYKITKDVCPKTGLPIAKPLSGVSIFNKCCLDPNDHTYWVSDGEGLKKVVIYPQGNVYSSDVTPARLEVN